MRLKMRERAFTGIKKERLASIHLPSSEMPPAGTRLIATVCLAGALLVYRPLQIPHSYSPVGYRSATLKNLIVGVGLFYKEE